MTNIFVASETPPEKKKSLVVSVHSFNLFTYEMDPNCSQLWREKHLSLHPGSFYTSQESGRLAGFVQASSTTNLRSLP